MGVRPLFSEIFGIVWIDLINLPVQEFTEKS